MNQEKRSASYAYFDTQIRTCSAEAAMLGADDRADEAVFVKIRLNVYDIFRTVFSVAARNAAEDDDKLTQFFFTKLQEIPRNWHVSHTSAEAHGNSEKAHIERIKLDTAEEIAENLRQIWEVAP